MVTELLIHTKPHAGHRIALRCEEFMVGSHQSCHLCLKNPAVPDRACCLLVTSDEVWIERLDDNADIRRNGHPVDKRQRIDPGDRLQVHDVVLSLCAGDRPLVRARRSRIAVTDDEIFAWLNEETSPTRAETAEEPTAL